MSASLNIHGFAAQALFEKLFHSLPDSIVVVDSQGCITDVNPQTEVLFGYAPNELLGHPVEMLVPERYRTVHKGVRRAYNEQPRLRPMGVGLDLYALRKDGNEFPVDIMLAPVEVGAQRIVLAVIRDITERKRLEQWMLDLALSDSLTGLGNHRRLKESFEAAAKRSQRTGGPVALLSLDLDGLKKINDNFGHLVGNRALCRIAEAIRAECRAVDTAARYGGDEFAVVMPDTEMDGAQNLAQRLISRLASETGEPRVAFSHGAAIYPRDGQTLEQLLARADGDLYQMKRSKH
jgi:diguanylate cyclase (GGDEF)-like protein/PAS domain S-box-containing protein